jgi:hypothetical protein
MLKFILLSIISFVVLFCNAQQKIVFEKRFNLKTKTYKLPKEVTCVFVNGRKSLLTLVQVKGDTLIFEKGYQQTKNFECTFNDLKKIKFHKNGEEVLYTLTATTTAITGICIAGFFVAISQYKQPNENGGFPAFILLPPLALITGSISALFYSTLPKSYNYIDYTIVHR